MKNRFLLTLSLLSFTILLFSSTINAQNNRGQVSGSVSDTNGKVISNASVTLKGTTYGATSNANGNYEFYAPNATYTIIVSYLGYSKQERKITLSGMAITKDFVLTESQESLDEVFVEGKKNLEAIVLESKSATKSNMSIMNTPAAIVAVNKGILDQQGITTLQEAIRNVSGVTQSGNNFNIGDNLSIRGLDVNYTLDGMYSGAGLGNTYNATRSLTNVERLEVLKGPTTGLYGIGSAGGIINFIEKKPEFEEHGLAEFRIGQWLNFRAMADYTAPLSDKFAFRIVTASESQKGYRDVSSERFETYGSLTFKSPSNVHNLTFSGAIISDAVDVDSTGDPLRFIEPGLLSNFDASSLINDPTTDVNGDLIGLQLTDAQIQALSNSLKANDGIEPFDIGDHSLLTGIAEPNKGKEFRAKLSYDLKPLKNLNITNQLLYRTYSSTFTRQTGALNYVYFLDGADTDGDGSDDTDVVNIDPRSPLVVNGTLFPLAARRQEYRSVEADEKALQYFGDFKYDWSLNSIKGEHLLSVNFENRNINFSQRSIVDADNIFGTDETNVVPYILDITDEDAIKSITGNFNDFAEVTRRTSIYEKTIQAYGVGFQEVLYLAKDKLTARLGGAFSAINQEFEDIDSESPVNDFDDSGFTYNLGLSYRPINQLSVFGNYSKGRTTYSLTGSISETDEANRDDSESKSIDLGIRIKTKNNRLLASIVAFQTSRTNIGYSNNEFDEVDNPNVPRFFYDLEDRTEGLEIDINYFFNKKLSFNANATFQNPLTLTGEEVTTEQTKGIPKNFARFWAEYKHFFNGSNNPLLVNFGVRYEDERAIDGFGLVGGHVNSYTVFDAGLGYNLNSKWNFRVNINNIFNTDYYAIALFAGGQPGEPLNLNFTTQYRF